MGVATNNGIDPGELCGELLIPLVADVGREDDFIHTLFLEFVNLLLGTLGLAEKIVSGLGWEECLVLPATVRPMMPIFSPSR